MHPAQHMLRARRTRRHRLLHRPQPRRTPS
jgi:hypothetical protein